MANELIKYYDSTYDDLPAVTIVAPTGTMSSTRQFLCFNAYEDTHPLFDQAYIAYLNVDENSNYYAIAQFIEDWAPDYSHCSVIIFDDSYVSGSRNGCYYGAYYNPEEGRLYLKSFTPQVGDYFFWVGIKGSIDSFSRFNSIQEQQGINFTHYYFSDPTYRCAFKVKRFLNETTVFDYIALPSEITSPSIIIGNAEGEVPGNPGSNNIIYVKSLDTEYVYTNTIIGYIEDSENYPIQGSKFKAHWIVSAADGEMHEEESYEYDYGNDCFFIQGKQVNNILQYQISSSNKRILKAGGLMGLYIPTGTTISAGSTLGTTSRFSSFTYDVGTNIAPSPSSILISPATNKGYIYIRKVTLTLSTNYTATFYRSDTSSWSQIGTVNLRYGATQNAVAFWTNSKVGKRYTARDELLYMGSDGKVWLVQGSSSTSSLAPTSKAQTVPIPYKTI